MHLSSMLAEVVTTVANDPSVFNTIKYGGGTLTVVLILGKLFELIDARDEKKARRSMVENLVQQTQLLTNLHGSLEVQSVRMEAIATSIATAAASQFTAAMAEKHKTDILLLCARTLPTVENQIHPKP